MFFIPILDRTTNQLGTLAQNKLEIILRGYERKSYPNSDLLGTHLPVNLLAYNFCKTQRDVYLYITGEVLPESWDRYQGRVVHYFYEIIYNKIREIITTSSIDKINIFDSLLTERDSLKQNAIKKYSGVYNKVKGMYGTGDLKKKNDDLAENLDKIFRFEVSLCSSLVNFEISRLYNQTGGDSLLQKAAALHVGQQFAASPLGFSDPVSPDFIYKQAVGDVKTGEWQEYYQHTIAAYALAVENHLREDVNCGVILHVNLDQSRKVPICEKTEFINIDDTIRRKFLIIRDQKLYIAKYHNDPGLPEDDSGCVGCNYHEKCWGV